jgi:hypothetical protein
MTTPDDWAKALTNFVDEIGGDGPYLWQWSGTTPTPEKVVGYLRDHVNYLEQRAKVQGAIDAGADTTPASGPLRRDQIDALLEELHDPALARQFLMDAGLIDADGQLTPPYRSQDEVPSRAWARLVLGPTDEEIDVLWDEEAVYFNLYGEARKFARSLLARWGWYPTTRPLTVEDLADVMRGDTLNPIAAGFTLEDLARHLLTHPATAPLLNSALPAQSKTPGLVEEDRIAVDQFAAAMKLKLSRKSKEGKQGWKEASAEHLSRLLCEHIRKGDPVDVANFAMMLHQNGQSITPGCTPLVDVDALNRTLNNTAEYMEPGSEDRWGVENVAFQLSEQPNRRPPSPENQDVKLVEKWLQDESREASYEGRVNMAEHFTRAANLIQEQEARIAELEAKTVELGRVGW